MFEKKLLPSFNYDKLGPDFLRYLERIEDLEEDNTKIQRTSQMRMLEWDSNISESQRSLRIMKSEVAEMKSHVQEMKTRFLLIVENFKTKGSSEDMEKITQQIDGWKPEELITRDEFLRLYRSL